MNPNKLVVPIFAIDRTESVRNLGFLGTASFVQRPDLLLTAEHVVRGCGTEFAFVVYPDISTIHTASLLEVDAHRDLALLSTKPFLATQALEVGDLDSIAFNLPVNCFEFGTTRVNGREIRLEPATRVGNVTRLVNQTELYGPAGESMLELSFPALRGASGAPVLSSNGFQVLGVIKANIGYQLLPAQVDTVVDDLGNMTEEIKYYLPQGLAVNPSVVTDFLSAAGL